jgi:CDP-diacylglycerol--serine O-phosphatidyltransferase
MSDGPAKQQKADRPPAGRGVYLLPNLLTTGALFAGFYAIVGAIDGNYHRSAIALLIAMLLDGLDGRVARLTGTESAFGREYDSLSDLVAFGVAPAIIVYQWGLVRLADYGWIWGKIGWLAAFLFAAAAALRLARFNVSARSKDRRFFEGLPSPSAAALVWSLVWLGDKLDWHGIGAVFLCGAATVAAGMLMVSRLPFYSFKDVSPRGRVSFTRFFVIPLIFVLIALDPPTVVFAMASTYAASGPALSLWRWRRRSLRRQEEGRTRRV